MRLIEKCRPKEWTDVVGQEKTITVIDKLRPRGLGGRAYWISGASGTGKTTIAFLLASEVANNLFINEIDASSLTPAKLTEYEQQTTYQSAWDGGGWAYIINEAHGLRKDTIRKLLDHLERLPEKVIIIFTTTTENMSLFEEGLDSNPLLSRCIELKLAKSGLAPKFAKRAREIALEEGLDGQPESEYLKLANRCKSNMRMMLQEIEKGVMIK